MKEMVRSFLGQEFQWSGPGVHVEAEGMIRASNVASRVTGLGTAQILEAVDAETGVTEEAMIDTTGTTDTTDTTGMTTDMTATIGAAPHAVAEDPTVGRHHEVPHDTDRRELPAVNAHALHHDQVAMRFPDPDPHPAPALHHVPDPHPAPDRLPAQLPQQKRSLLQSQDLHPPLGRLHVHPRALLSNETGQPLRLDLHPDLQVQKEGELPGPRLHRLSSTVISHAQFYFYIYYHQLLQHTSRHVQLKPHLSSTARATTVI